MRFELPEDFVGQRSTRPRVCIFEKTNVHMKFVLIIIALAITYCTCSYLDSEKTKKVENELLIKLNLNLEGVIENVDLPPSYNSYGIIHIKILNSNIIQYIPPPSQPFFYCTIKMGIAEIYDHAAGYKIGDTIRINTKEKTIITNNNMEKIEFTTINTSRNYYNYIRENSTLLKD